LPHDLWQEYVVNKQTYKQLATKYCCSIKTIQRKLDSITTNKESTFSCFANVLMDTTYFGPKLGLMVFKKRAISGNIISF